MPPRYFKVYDVPEDEVNVPNVQNRPPPSPVGSGAPPRPRNLPKFPNNTDLVLDDKNTPLLAALLPALAKFNCIQSSAATKTRRSPWVRAYCDLYHPAGPWGSNKFQNAPELTSTRKYSFKSYQIPMIYKQLQKYHGNSGVHRALKQALEEHFTRDAWVKEFLEGCQQVAAVEATKPMAERAAIPSVEAGVIVRVATAQQEQQQDTEIVTNEETRASPIRSRKRESDEANLDTPRSRTRAQQRKLHEEEEEVTSAPANSPSTRAPSQKPVSPETEQGSVAIGKKVLEEKRAELVRLLSGRSDAMDSICQRIKKEIDNIDEELLEMILG